MSAAVEVLELVRRRGGLTTGRIRESLALGDDELCDALETLRARRLVHLEGPDDLNRIHVLPVVDRES